MKTPIRLFLFLPFSLLLVLLSASVSAAPQETLSAPSKPIQGKAPVYVEGEAQPVVSGEQYSVEDAASPIPLSETSVVDGFELKAGKVNVTDSDKDSDPSLRIEPLNNLTPLTRKPLFRWWLLDQTDPVNGPRQSVTFDQYAVGTRFVDIAPGRRISLEVNADLIPFTLTGFPREGTRQAQQTVWQFIIPERTAGVLSDELFSPLPAAFPVNGFRGGFFYFITPYLPSDYDFSVVDSRVVDSNAPSASPYFMTEVEGGRVKVTLLGQPPVTEGEFPRFILRAVPKAGVNAAVTRVEHPFTLERWLVYGDEVLSGEPMPVTFAVGASACRTLGAGWGIPPARYLVNPFNDGTFSSRSLTGNLWNEWGSVANVTQEPWSVAGLVQNGDDYSGYYWTTDTTPEGLQVGAHLGNGLSERKAFPGLDIKMNLVCALNLDGSQLEIPQVRDMVLSGEFLAGNRLIVSYSFDTALSREEDPQEEDRSRYSYGVKGRTTVQAAGRVQLIESGTGVYASGEVAAVRAPELVGSGVTEFALPALTEAQVGQVLEVSVLPINKIDAKGAIQTVATDSLFSAGNQTYLRELTVAEHVFPIRDELQPSGGYRQNLIYPQTGFVGASFQLGVKQGLSNSNFDWQVVQGGEYAEVDSTGRVTLRAMPLDDTQEVIVRGVAKPTVYRPYLQYDAIRPAFGAIEYVYRFTLKQWYETDTTVTETALFPAQNACLALNSAKQVSNFAIPSYRYQLVDVTTLDNTVNTPFIAANGKLFNEWGDLRQYSSQGGAFSADNYWVAEVGDVNNRNLNQRIGWQSSTREAVIAGRAQSPKVATGTQLLCGRNLDGSELYGVPRIEKMTVAGAITEGSKLTLAYTFRPNNGDEVSADNLSAVDFTTVSSTYDGTDAVELVLETNTRTISLTPVRVNYDTETQLYRGEFTVGPLPLEAEDEVVAVSVRPINREDIAGYTRVVDSTMSPEEGNLLYRGFPSVSTPKNPALFYPGELESPLNFPTTGFTGALFRLNTSADPADLSANQRYNWQIQFDAPDAGSPSAADYFRLGQTGDEAGNIEMLAPPANRRVYVVAVDKSNANIKRLYSFLVNKWYSPDFLEADSFHSVETLTNPQAYPINQPTGDSTDYSTVFPTTGFKDAQFKLNIGVGGVLNSEYSWSVSWQDGSPTDAITVDNNGVVTLLKRPTSSQGLKVTATPQNPKKLPLNYVFKLKKWYSADLADAGFHSIDTLGDVHNYPINQPQYGAPNDYSRVFPQTGFKGAKFRLNIGAPGELKNAQYRWTSSSPELVSVGNGVVSDGPEGAGTVTLLAKPEEPTLITITAKPIASEIDSEAELKYTFRLARWFDPATVLDISQLYDVYPFGDNTGFATEKDGNPLKAFPIIQPDDTEGDYSNTFPTTGFKGAKFLIRLDDNRVSGVNNNASKSGRVNINNLYDWVSSHPDLVQVGNDVVNYMTPSNNQSLYGRPIPLQSAYTFLNSNSAGVVTLLKAPDSPTIISIKAIPKVNDPGRRKVHIYRFKLNRWLMPYQGDVDKFNSYRFTTPFTASPTSAPTLLADYSKTFPVVAWKDYSFQFKINDNTYNNLSRYYVNGLFDWSTSEDGKADPIVIIDRSSITSTSSENYGILKFLREPDPYTPITVYARPNSRSGLDGGDDNVLTYTFMIKKWFQADFPPIQVINFDSITVLGGSTRIVQIIQPTGAPATSADYSNTFPTIGFKDAKFRLNIGSSSATNNDAYLWQSSQPDIAEVDANGVVTLKQAPVSQTVVTISATPMMDKTNSTAVLTYSFKLQKWFDYDLPSPLVFHSISTPDSPLPNGDVIPVNQTLKNGTDFSAVFPQTGFVNARFKLNIGDALGSLNNQYEWSIDNPDLVIMEETDPGIVRLLKKPKKPTVITVSAIPKDTSQGATPLYYRFKLSRWFDATPPLPDEFSVITTPLIDSTARFSVNSPVGTNYSNVFPNTAFTQAMFRLSIGAIESSSNDNYNWTTTSSNYLKVGNAPGLPETDPESAGNITFIAKPPRNYGDFSITATAKNTDAEGKRKVLTYTFKPSRWFATDIEQSIIRFSSATTLPDGFRYPIDAGFPKTGFNNARFRLDIYNSDKQLLNSEYEWQSSHPELVSVGNGGLDTSATGAGNVTLLVKPLRPTQVTITAKPKVTSVTRPTLTYNFTLNKWYRVNEPYGIPAFRNIVPIDLYLGGSTIEPPVTIPIRLPAENGSFANVFPRTGFVQARFRLNAGYNGYKNEEYTWTSSAPEVKVGNQASRTGSAESAGNVTLLAPPTGPVTITATPKVASPTQPVLSYVFRPERWFDPRTELAVKQFVSITNPNQPTLAQIAVVQNGDDFSQTYPQTGFDSAMFRLNLGTKEGRFNSFYSWSTSEDGKPTPLATVGNGPVSGESNGAGNVTLLRRPSAPTVITVTAKLKPEYFTAYPNFTRELTYRFKVNKWFAANITPIKLSSSFDSLSTPAAMATGGIRQPLNGNYRDVFPQYGFEGANFVLHPTPLADNSQYTWSSSNTNLATVSTTGVVTLTNEPSQAESVVIRAIPKSPSNIRTYQYEFKVAKWVRYSTSAIQGYFEAAPNSRWPAPNLWTQSLGTDAERTGVNTNPDNYCRNVGNGYRSMNLQEYTLNYPTYRPFVFTLVTELTPRITVGALAQEWGTMAYYRNWPQGNYWMAEPATTSTRISVNSLGFNARLDRPVSESLYALCVRELQ